MESDPDLGLVSTGGCANPGAAAGACADGTFSGGGASIRGPFPTFPGRREMGTAAGNLGATRVGGGANEFCCPRCFIYCGCLWEFLWVFV